MPEKLVKQTHRRFPDYAFARIALARLAIQEERIEEAHVGRAKADLGAVSAALLMFRELQGRFPEDLAELMDPPAIADGQSEVYLAKPPEDPVTGRLYLYVHEGKSVRLGFLGADGVEGGTGLDEDIWVTVPRE